MLIHYSLLVDREMLHGSQASKNPALWAASTANLLSKQYLESRKDVQSKPEKVLMGTSTWTALAGNIHKSEETDL